MNVCDGKHRRPKCACHDIQTYFFLFFFFALWDVSIQRKKNLTFDGVVLVLLLPSSPETPGVEPLLAISGVRPLAGVD